MDDRAELFSAMLAIAGVVITCENAFLLMVISKCKGQKSKYIFTASLAMTDLCMGLNFLLGATVYHPDVTSVLGRKTLGTTVYIFVATIMSGLSVAHMAVIAVERFLYMVHPFSYERHLTPRGMRLALCAVWTLGVAVLLFLALVHGTQEYMAAMLDWPKPVAVSYLVCYVILTGVALVCYVLVLLEVRKKGQALARTGVARSVPSRWRENAKCVKFFMTVFGAHFVTTCPGVLLHMMENFDINAVHLRRFLFTLVGLNSGVNFVILTVLDSQFRSHTKKAICPCKKQ